LFTRSAPAPAAVTRADAPAGFSLVLGFRPSACAAAAAGAVKTRRPMTHDVPLHYAVPFGFRALRTVLMALVYGLRHAEIVPWN